MKIKHKAMKPLTFRRCLNKARKCVDVLKDIGPQNPAWEGMVIQAKYWKGLAMDKATTNDEISEASQI